MTAVNLNISVSTRPSHMLVSLTGECDTTTAPHLLNTLMAQAAAGTLRVVIDLSGLRFIDSAGIHALLNGRSALAQNQGTLALASPQRIVARVLELTGIGQLIPIHQTVAEAMAPN
jgi:anti-sigma B factor antagonist